jgi:hypothetical protein
MTLKYTVWNVLETTLYSNMDSDMDLQGESAIHLAAERGNTAALKVLIAARGDVTTKDVSWPGDLSSTQSTCFLYRVIPLSMLPPAFCRSEKLYLLLLLLCCNLAHAHRIINTCINFLSYSQLHPI